MDLSSAGLNRPLLHKRPQGRDPHVSTRSRASPVRMGAAVAAVSGVAGVAIATLVSWICPQDTFAEIWQPAVKPSALLSHFPRVELPCGPVEGVWENGLAAFRGIPYGMAPVGDRRWQPPMKSQCWGPEVLQAHVDGNICYQGGEDAACESEDCLNLNVFSRPSSVQHSGTATPLVPVLVWIYGGANVAGSVSSYGHIESLVREGSREVVLVAMNYRVGIFGFLALKELSLEDPRGVSGNYGIADQQLALQWVQENIQNFGGDPQKVTIIGQSSGGTNVLAHLSAAHSRGLFHRAIALSGAPNITMDRATKEAWDAERILATSPCSNSSAVAACLRGLDTHSAWAALPDSYALFDTLYDYPTDHRGLASRVSPLIFVDGVTVTHPVQDALLMGLSDVPLLVQSMQAEMDCSPVGELQNITKDSLQAFFQNQFAPAYGAAVASKINALYENYTDPLPAYGVYAVDADACAACGNRHLVQHAKEGFTSPVYWSVVTGAPDRPFDMYGQWSMFPFHAWDVIAATGTWSSYDAANAGSTKRYEPSENDQAFGRMLREQWLQLASEGILDSMEWKPAQEAPPHKVWGSIVSKTNATPTFDMKAEVCDFWASIGVGQNWWWIN